MDPKIATELAQEEMTPFHTALLMHVRNLVLMSRRHMSKFYSDWDRHDEIYRGFHHRDQQDVKASERKEPEKMVIPLSYSQIQTFIAFCFSVYYQKEHFYEMVGMGQEDHKPAKVAEALLQRDLNYNIFERILDQFLLDICRFGLGILKTGWYRKVERVMETQNVPGRSFFGVPLGGARQVEQLVEKVKFLGNLIVNISPYRFYPDVRLPLSRLQDGEFCASEEEAPFTKLKQLEKEGVVAGVDYVKPLTRLDYEARGFGRLPNTTILDSVHGMTGMPGGAQTKGVHVLTECQVTLVPSEFRIGNEPMGPEDYPTKYNVWYVNDKRIVKAEPLGYVHDQYTYDVAEFNPDFHQLINQGLSGTIDQLQNVISWFINSHITSVRKTIQNWLIVDPQGVNMDDLVKRNPVIRLKPNVSSTGVDRWVKQLDVRDVTQAHIGDAKELQDTVQVVTGINDNAMGIYNSGRRSATEARNVNASAAGRLKKVALLIYKSALEPMARKMVSNLRDGLDEEQYVKVVGGFADPQTMSQFLKVDKAALAGDYDFEVYDGTLPSERGNQAEALKELVLGILQEPQLIPLLGYDVRALLKEILELKGIRNPERFYLTQLQQQQLQQVMQGFQQVNATEPGLVSRNGQQTAQGFISVPERTPRIPVGSTGVK